VLSSGTYAGPVVLRNCTVCFNSSSGIGGGYPRGLVVGVVVNVTHSDAATVDMALVDWVNNPATLTLVIVVTDFTPS